MVRLPLGAGAAGRAGCAPARRFGAGRCRRHALALTAALWLAGACRSVEAIEDAPPWPTPKRGMVVSEQRFATEVGASILDLGGNAVDAAVATALALAVVYPQAGNLGGGGFAVYVPHGGDPVALDFRETAPRSAAPERFRGADGAIDPARTRSGALAVGVPGSPAGLWALHDAYGSGRLSWSDLVWPALQLAADGFTVDRHLHDDLLDPDVRARMSASPAALATFYPGGEPLARGARLRQPELAETLVTLSREGPRSFYTGAIAELIVREIERLADLAGEDEPWITKQDLAEYQPVWRKPLAGWFRGHEIITMPPPSSGGIIVLQALSVLEGLPIEAQRERVLDEQRIRGTDVAARGHGPELGFDERLLHWWIEALRWTFAGRAEYMGDPDFGPVPVAELLSAAWIASCRVGLGETAQPELRPQLQAPPPEGSQTTHLSVLDGDGNAVSLTTTLNSEFGAGVVVTGAGFFLNNEIDDFALLGGVPNQFGLVGSAANLIAPGKRPLSSMTPTVVRDGGYAVTMVLGSPGGPRIITSVFGVLVRTLLLGQDLESAVRAPRLHQQWRPVHTEFEPGWDAALVDQLRTRRGHDVHTTDWRWGSVQAIALPIGGEPIGFSDPRRGGSAQAQRR